MGLLRRSKPLHERLADAGGVELARVDSPAAGRPSAPAAQPPGWDGEQRGEPGVHGVPRARRWDAVVTVTAAGLSGDRISFVGIAEGDVLVEEDEPAAALEPLIDAVEERIAPPYRAEAVRRDGDRWAVAASRITVLEVRGLRGDEAELVSTREGRVLEVDGRPAFGSAPDLERAGEAVGTEFVVRARRLEGDRWEIEATPL